MMRLMDMRRYHSKMYEYQPRISYSVRVVDLKSHR